MKKVEIKTFEDIHHVCLIYAVKGAFGRFPFLARNIMSTPPPVRWKPERPNLPLGFRKNPVTVLFYQMGVQIVYNPEMANLDAVLAFAQTVMEEYLTLRHPYMKTEWHGSILTEQASGHLVADIIALRQETDDRP